MCSDSLAIRLGTIFKVPLYFEWLHLFIPLMLFAAWYMPVVEEVPGADLAVVSISCIILTELCLLAHEFAHVRVGQFLGYSTKEVRMNMFGAVAIMAGTGRTPSHQFLIAVAGPIVSLLLWLLFLYGDSVISHTENVNIMLISMLTVKINLIIAVFNLLPIYPMDGGRILVAILQIFTKCFVKAMKIGAWIAIIFCVYGLYYAYENSALVLGFFAVLLIMISIGTLKSSHGEILAIKGGIASK